MLKKLMLFAVLLGLATFAGSAKVSAVSPATSQKPTGITISPAFQQVDIGNVSEQPLSFSITNDKSTIQKVKLTTSDFNTLSETGGLFFVGANPTELQKKYALSKWLQLPYDELSLEPGQTVTVNAKVLNLEDLAPGGHYGAINFLVENKFGGTANNINVQPVASTLLFVTKLGGDTHKLSLASVKANQGLFSMPTYINLNFKNDGNTHLIPRGVVKVLSSSDKLISQATINLNSDIILPEVSRLYSVPLRQLVNTPKPGKYKIEVDFRFDGVDQVRAYQTSFWYIPIAWISSIALLVVIVTLAGHSQLKKKTTKHHKNSVD